MRCKNSRKIFAIILSILLINIYNYDLEVSSFISMIISAALNSIVTKYLRRSAIY